MNLKATARNVLCYIETDNKEKYKFKSGVELYVVRGFNYNLREDNPSIAEVIDGEGFEQGDLILVHHNASHPTYHIEGIEAQGGQIIKNLYSVPQDMIFCRKGAENKDWIPNKDFLITLRVYKPYAGLIQGVQPDLVVNRLYVVKGDVDGYNMEGKVACVSPYSDYEIIYREDNIEKSVIRTRSREILGVDLSATEKVLSGEYLVGNNLSDTKKLNQ